MSNNYHKDSKTEIENKINSRKNATDKNEASIQNTFEKYPFAIVGSVNLNSRYSFFGNIVVSQPRFKSYSGDRQPDFLVATWDSLNIYFNFIEIEDPSKKIFKNNSKELTSEFLQAYNQLRQWRSYDNEVIDYCNDLLDSLHDDNFNNTSNKKYHYNYILVYGFGEEIEQLTKSHNNLLQDYFKDEDFNHCTYSRLIRNLRVERPMFTVVKDAKSNKFKAIGVTPFTKYGKYEWSDFHKITSKEEIINKSEFFTQEEKTALIKKITEMDSKTYNEIIELSKKGIGLNFWDPGSHKI